MTLTKLVAIALCVVLGLLAGIWTSLQDQWNHWYLGPIVGSFLGGMVPIAVFVLGWMLTYIGSGGPILDLYEFTWYVRTSFGRIGGQMRRVGIWAVLGSVLMLFWAVLLTTFAVLLFSKRVVIPTNQFVPKYSANWYIGCVAALVAIILVAIGTYRLVAAACSHAGWHTALREERIESRTKFLLLNPISLPFVIIWATGVLFSPLAYLIVHQFRRARPQP